MPPRQWIMDSGAAMPATRAWIFIICFCFYAMCRWYGRRRDGGARPTRSTRRTRASIALQRWNQPRWTQQRRAMLIGSWCPATEARRPIGGQAWRFVPPRFSVATLVAWIWNRPSSRWLQAPCCKAAPLTAWIWNRPGWSLARSWVLLGHCCWPV